MRILITGAAGLYGVHLIDKLVQSKKVSTVIGVDNFSRHFIVKNPFIKTKEFTKKFHLIKGDFRDLEVKDFNRLNLDVVVHLAAYISIPESMERMEDYFQNNEYGTFKLIYSLVKTKNKPFLIYASSTEVYGEAIYTPMDLNHPMLPRSIYAVTKLAGEKHLSAMHEWYGYPITIFRNFNTYGENQDIKGNAAVVACFIQQALKNKNLFIHGNGSQTRDFQYVKDAVESYKLAIFNPQKVNGKTFNIGTGHQTSIKDMALKIKELTASKSKIVFVPRRGADLKRLEADYSEINKVLGWKPKYTLEEGLKRTIEWYKKYL